ncbi:MAG: hypothetical protein ABI797_07000 [Chloroflexota bacterium]
MGELNVFEQRFEARVRAFALRGVPLVNSAAVARAVVARHPRRTAVLPTDRRAWVAVLAVASIIVLVVGLLPHLNNGPSVGTTSAPSVSPSPNASSSPSAGRFGLVYATEDAIWVSNADGSNAVRVATGDSGGPCGLIHANDGLVSPDGRYLAYRSTWDDVCGGGVYLADPSGRVIASLQGTGWNIAWSPDSTLFATWTGPGKAIGVYGINGVSHAVLDGSLMCCGDYDPEFSPDGAPSILVKNYTTVWELPLDGGPARAIPITDPRSRLASGWNRRKVGYSPDGTRAAFFDGASLTVASADGSGERVLALLGAGPEIVQGGSGPLWSPSGRQLAYVDQQPLGGATVIRVVDVTTLAVTNLATPADPTVALLGFSPDGTQILHSQTDEAGGVALWVAQVDGSGGQIVVSNSSIGGWVSLDDAL